MGVETVAEPVEEIAAARKGGGDQPLVLDKVGERSHAPATVLQWLVPGESDAGGSADRIAQGALVQDRRADPGSIGIETPRYDRQAGGKPQLRGDAGR